MSGDVHVQFCEQHRGRLPVLTYLLILLKTKRQLTRARKKIFTILHQLKLEISPSKTKIGPLKDNFHFLGVNFAVSRNPQSKTQVTAHPRTYRRALDKVEQMQNPSPQTKSAVVCADNKVRLISELERLTTHAVVHPATIQRYLIRFATWWHRVLDVPTFQLIAGWADYADEHRAWSAWLGSGLLLGTKEARAVVPAHGINVQ